MGLLDFLAQPSTADIRGALRNIPVRKGGILPLTEYGDGSARLDWTAGVPGSIMEAFTAPARAYRGEIAPDQMVPEGLNFAGSVALGSAAVPRPRASVGMGGKPTEVASHLDMSPEARGSVGMGSRPEPGAQNPKAGAIGSPAPTTVLAENGAAGTQPSVFDVADQVARMVGGEPRHHRTSFGSSSYIGPWRISDHPVGSGRFASEGPGFDYRMGADAIAAEINAARQQQIIAMLNEPPPQRQPWMSGRDWMEARKRFENRRPWWLSEQEWSEIKSKKKGLLP